MNGPLNRRRFVGTTLGIAVASGLPLVGARIRANQAVRPWTAEGLVARPLTDLLACQCGVLVDGEGWLRGPGILAVTARPGGLDFKFDDIRAATEFRCHSLLLADPHGHHIARAAFAGGVQYLSPGDVLKGTYTFLFAAGGRGVIPR